MTNHRPNDRPADAGLTHNSPTAVAAALAARGYRYGGAPFGSYASGLWSRCVREDADGVRHYVHVYEYAPMGRETATTYEAEMCFARSDGSWAQVRFWVLRDGDVPHRLDAIESALARAREALTDALPCSTPHRADAMTTTEHYTTPCEVRDQPDFNLTCGQPSTYRYRAMGGGFMHLCEAHGAQHADISQHVTRGLGSIAQKYQHDFPARPA